MQTRKRSVIESFANVLAGYWLAVASQIVIFPAFGIHIPVRTNFVIGLWFTVTSVIRSYTLRRLFARWEAGR